MDDVKYFVTRREEERAKGCNSRAAKFLFRIDHSKRQLEGYVEDLEDLLFIPVEVAEQRGGARTRRRRDLVGVLGVLRRWVTNWFFHVR